MASTDPIIESSYYFLLLFWLEGVMLRSCYQRCGMTQTCRSPTVSPSYQTNSSEKNKWDKRETHVPLQSPSADCNSLSLCVTDMYKSAFFFKWWIIEGRDRLTRNAKKEKKKKRHEKETQKWKERGKVCKKKKTAKHGRKSKRLAQFLFIQSANSFLSCGDFGWIRDVGKLVQVEPLVGFFAVKVVNPIADAVLLVESSSGSAHVRNTATVLVAHMEQHALKFLIGVKSKGTVSAVEGESHVRELLPAFSSVQGRKRVNQSDGEYHAEEDCYLTHHFWMDVDFWITCSKFNYRRQNERWQRFSLFGEIRECG